MACKWMYLDAYKTGFIWKRKERLPNSGTCIVKSITLWVKTGILNGLFHCLLVWTDEAKKLDEAAALPPKEPSTTETDAAIAAAMAATVNGAEIEIDEDLFGGDDIDDVEDELETLDLVDD